MCFAYDMIPNRHGKKIRTHVNKYVNPCVSTHTRSYVGRKNTARNYCAPAATVTSTEHARATLSYALRT